MLKPIGAVMVISAASLCGFMKSGSLKKRELELKKIISALKLAENEIAYGKRDIKSILLIVGELQNSEIFRAAGTYIDKNGIKNGFKRAVDDNGGALCSSDREILFMLAENLGMTDSATQIKSLHHARALLETEAEKACAEYEKNGRLYRGTGILAGAAAVILLL